MSGLWSFVLGGCMTVVRDRFRDLEVRRPSDGAVMEPSVGSCVTGVVSGIMETHSQFLGGMTRRLARRLVQDAQMMSLQAVSPASHPIGWHLIMGLVTDWSGLTQTRRRRQRCRVLLIDETSIGKSHRYVTVAVNGDAGQVLAIVKERSKAGPEQVLHRARVQDDARVCAAW